MPSQSNVVEEYDAGSWAMMVDEIVEQREDFSTYGNPKKERLEEAEEASSRAVVDAMPACCFGNLPAQDPLHGCLHQQHQLPTIH